MSLNWKEINLLLSELELVGSFVEKWTQSDFRNVFMRISRPRFRCWIRFCFESGRTCMHATSKKPANAQTLLRFAAFLRSRYCNATIVEATQPGNDRVVMLRLKKQDEYLRLYIRLWGGSAGNIIATDDENIILDLLYRKKTINVGDLFEWKLAPAPSDREIRPYDKYLSLNEIIEQSYDQVRHDEALTNVQQRFDALCGKRLAYLRQSISMLKKSSGETELAQRYRFYADSIMASLNQCIKGDRILYFGGQEIALNPQLSPYDNAAYYYELLRDMRIKQKHSEEKLARLNTEYESFVKAMEALDRDQLPDLRSFLQRYEKENKQKTQQALSIPGIAYYSHSFTILVGRSARENDTLLRRHTRGNDLWFHARDYPGSYVFIKLGKNSNLPTEVLLDAASLAMFYSKGRKNGNGDVYYTYVKYLRRGKHGIFGTVLPQKEKNIYVRLEQKRLAKLGIGVLTT